MTVCMIYCWTGRLGDPEAIVDLITFCHTNLNFAAEYTGKRKRGHGEM